MELMLSNRKRCDFPFNVTTEVQDMSLAVVNRAMDLISETRGQPLILNGNEPALNPDLLKILEMLNNAGAKTVIETSGLMTDSARRAIIANKPIVAWRLYRPDFYSKEDLEEARATIKQFQEAQLNVQLIAIIDDLKADYSHIAEWLQTYRLGVMVVRLDCKCRPAEANDVITSMSDLMRQMIIQGATAIYDCNPLSCAFEDATLGMLTKLGVKRGGCNPHLLVMPDGHMAHCREMTMIPGPDVSTFKNVKDLVDYYYEIFRQMQVNVDEDAPCSKCITRKVGLCTGPNMAFKATNILAEREYLKPLLASPKDPDGEEHMHNTWVMAVDSLKLGMYDDAIQCLEEMRRMNPENPDIHFWLAYSYWELGRRDEAEEEFRKCSRLSENHVPALWELHQRLVKNGNTIRARMLLEEIKKLAAKQKAEMESKAEK